MYISNYVSTPLCVFVCLTILLSFLSEALTMVLYTYTAFRKHRCGVLGVIISSCPYIFFSVFVGLIHRKNVLAIVSSYAYLCIEVFLLSFFFCLLSSYTFVSVGPNNVILNVLSFLFSWRCIVLSSRYCKS